MISGQADSNPTPERISASIFLFVIGITLMMVTDVQKYVRLQYK